MHRKRCVIFFLLIILIISIKIDAKMPDDENKLLFQDKLNGSKQKGWKIAPNNFVRHPEYGSVYYIKPQKPPQTGLPWVGDESWCRYRVELELLPAGQGRGFIGLDFHVRNDGKSCCNMHFSDADTDHVEIIQSCGRWYPGNTSWKLMPLSQRRPHLKKGKWVNLRLDIGKTIANVYVNNDSTPVYTIYDLPFTSGGIRLWTNNGAAYARNLKITSLGEDEVNPELEDLWARFAKSGIIRNWQITPLQTPQFGRKQLPPELAETDIEWLNVKADRRGIVNITALFPDNENKTSVFVRTTIHSTDRVVRRCLFSYTDQLKLWCNGQLIITGEPRGWLDPGRDESDGWGRLLPDLFASFVELLPGENVILIRLAVNEPYFGSGFWIRLQ